MTKRITSLHSSVQCSSVERLHTPACATRCFIRRLQDPACALSEQFGEGFGQKQTSSTVWHTYEIEKGQNIIKNFKRHSDGTFTNDFTHYLDKIKAKDFVEWLTSNSRVGVVERWDENQSLVVEA
ncbi:unnamed protein product [Gadus morhua 'NCC']